MSEQTRLMAYCDEHALLYWQADGCVKCGKAAHMLRIDLSAAEIALIIEGLEMREMWGFGNALADRFRERAALSASGAGEDARERSDR